MKEAKTALEKADGDSAHYKDAAEKLFKAIEPAVMEMYKAQADAAGAAAPDASSEGGAWTGKPDGPESKDQPIDADFTEKGDKK